jgi:hypothetical protein
MKTKKDYIKSIADKGLLWSYMTDGVEDFPESVVIEQVLRMGDVEDIIMLFRLFDEENIKNVWINKLLADSRIKAQNYYLARVFFNIDNPKEFFKNGNILNRYERLEKLTS